MNDDTPQVRSSTPYFAVMVAVISVSFASIFILWSSASPIVIAAYRMLLASLMLLPFAIGPFRKQFMTLSWRTVAILALIGVVLALHFYTFNTSLTLTTVAAATLLVTAHPLIIGVLSVFYLKETDKRALIGMVIGFSGIVWISLSGLGDSEMQGNVLAFIGALLAAIYILGGRMMRRSVDIVPYAFLVYTFAAIFLFASCFVMSVPVLPLSTNDVLIFLLLAGVSTIMGHTLYNWSLKYVTASLVSVSLLGEPILASVLAIFFFSQFPSPLIIVSGIMLLIGVVIVAKYEVKIENV